MIFLDRSIPRSVADSLKAVRRNDVVWLEDYFPHNVPDEEWIPEVGRRGWIAVVRDKKIRARRWRRDLVSQHGLGCVIVNQKRDPTLWEYYKLFGQTLDEVERLDATAPRPYMLLVTNRWSLRTFPL